MGNELTVYGQQPDLAALIAHLDRLNAEMCARIWTASVEDYRNGYIAAMRDIAEACGLRYSPADAERGRRIPPRVIVFESR